MKQAEKYANELVDRFINLLGNDAVGRAYAKDCSLICVAEKMRALIELKTKYSISDRDYDVEMKKLIDVKQAINKL